MLSTAPLASVAYGTSWLERQDNVKVIDRNGAPRENLARETGKNWYVRLPDGDCQAGARLRFASSRILDIDPRDLGQSFDW